MMLTNSNRHAYPFSEKPVLDLDFTESLDSRITFTRASTATYFDSAGVLQTAASGVARVKAHTYDGTNWNNRGLLIEEARTNLALQSEEFDNGTWIKDAGASVTADQYAFVDGNTTADKVVYDGTFNTAIKQQFGSLDLNTQYTFSVWVSLQDGTPSADNIVQINAFGATTATVTNNIGSDLTTSLQRFDLVFTTDGVGGTVIVQVRGDEAVTLGLGGAQVESGPFPTSYIPTTTAQVTRAADVATMNSFATDIFNSQEGAFSVRVMRESINTGKSSNIVFVDTASGTPQLDISARATGSTFRARFDPPSGNVGITDRASEIAGTESRLAFSYAQDDLAMSLNGGSVAADATANMATGYDIFAIGQANSIANTWFNGYIARITYWNRRLPNGRLQDKTS